MITMFMTRWYPCRARSGDPSEGDHQRDEHPQGEAEADEVQATRPAGADAEGGHQETEKSGQIDHSSTYYLAPCCRIPRVIVWQGGLECVQQSRDRLALDLAGPERPINRGSELRRCRWNALGEPLASLAAGDINRALAAIVPTGDQGQTNSSTPTAQTAPAPRAFHAVRTAHPRGIGASYPARSSRPNTTSSPTRRRLARCCCAAWATCATGSSSAWASQRSRSGCGMRPLRSTWLRSCRVAPHQVPSASAARCTRRASSPSDRLNRRRWPATSAANGSRSPLRPAGATLGPGSLVVVAACSVTASAPTWRRSRASSPASARMRSSTTVSALTSSTAAGDDGEHSSSQSWSACTHSGSSSPGAPNTRSQSAANAPVQRTSASSTADR